MSQWTELDSSNIRACRYFRKTGLLIIKFKSGGMYAYADVPWGVYMGFRRASSHGSYFSRLIRDEYGWQEITEENAKGFWKKLVSKKIAPKK